MSAFAFSFRLKSPARRRFEREQRVIAAIGQLRPEFATLGRIARLAYLGPGSVVGILARLEGSGEVVSDWADGPYPRRRVYSVVKSAVVR
jgi:hypothetical protein